MSFKQTEENTLKRGHKKASYDKQVVYDILDSNEICSVAFNVKGKAHVQPINYGRCNNRLYLHGHAKNRMTGALIEAGEVVLSVMILDAMKLTRSAYNHSVNYRSVVVFGKVRELASDQEKLQGLKCIINHFMPDRWDHCRAPNEMELKATRVLEIEIESASAKIADTPPTDEPEDYDSGFWAGMLPVRTVVDYPIADKTLAADMAIPDHVLDFYQRRK